MRHDHVTKLPTVKVYRGHVADITPKPPVAPFFPLL